MQHSILNSYKKDILENKTMTAKCKRVLETSIDLFAKNGYSNTSTSEIAKIAGVAEGTIFKHFGTKENLLLSSIMPFIFDYVLPEMIIDFEDVEIKDIYPDFTCFWRKNIVIYIAEVFAVNLAPALCLYGESK